MTTDPDYPAPAYRTRNEAHDIETIAKAQGVIAGLLGLIVVILVVGLVFAFVGYNKIAERLDNIENSTHETAEYTAPPPAVAP